MVAQLKAPHPFKLTKVPSENDAADDVSNRNLDWFAMISVLSISSCFIE